MDGVNTYNSSVLLSGLVSHIKGTSKLDYILSCQCLFFIFFPITRLGDRLVFSQAYQTQVGVVRFQVLMHKHHATLLSLGKSIRLSLTYEVF